MTTITTRVIGGLGNQMFQYAAARALALRRGAKVQLDLSAFDTYTLRKFELGSFPIQALPAPPAETQPSRLEPRSGALSLGGTLIRSALAAVYRFSGRRAADDTRYAEPHFHFDRKLAEQALPLHMVGYWQSERYFSDAADIIRAELTSVVPLEVENAAIAAEIKRVESVSVHVRRGDYVNDATTNAVHGSCSLDYYRRAIDFMCERLTSPHVFVFSDDQKWVQDNLRFNLPITYVNANPPDRGYRDMQLMSLCRHHVIANSSFSWWGAWLNPSKDKIVVAPERWFASDELDTRDLLPERWVRL
ncbi:alpha-1,2-fucosyltransferase [Bosea sp. 2RAB26]|uniref:alpha-1,2-fucosyltransferase n=1 Tax=Bosea sp. 2RAB26 TaxID=3237476 RepID=UPI003F916949